jgi:hypothetical protein
MKAQESSSMGRFPEVTGFTAGCRRKREKSTSKLKKLSLNEPGSSKMQVTRRQQLRRRTRSSGTYSVIEPLEI